MSKKRLCEDWEEYAKSKTVTCAVSGTSMEKPKTITQMSKEQLEDMCIHLMSWNHEQVHRANELEDRIVMATKFIQESRGLLDIDYFYTKLLNILGGNDE